MKKVFLKTFGCQMNMRDSEVVRGILLKAGFAFTQDPAEAAVVLFNTCSVRQHAEEKVWSGVGQIVRSAKRKSMRKGQLPCKPPLIGIIGCMAQNYQEKIFERAPEVSFVVGPADIDKIPGILIKLIGKHAHTGAGSALFETRIWETQGDIRPEEIYHAGFYEDKEHAYVVISEGCSNFCSYCVVPHVRGKLHHRSDKDILQEIREAAAGGVTKVTLLGQNVNAYRCGDTDFIALLHKVNALEGLQEFTFITSHPKDASTRLFEAIQALPKLKKYLHLPVQSGSDRILSSMNRQYTRDAFRELIRQYRVIVKGGMLSTDIIVGYPSETDDEFMDTYNLIKEIRCDAAFIFKYSPRPHTAAAQVCDDVPKEEKERRHAMVLGLQKKISKEKR